MAELIRPVLWAGMRSRSTTTACRSRWPAPNQVQNKKAHRICRS